MLEVFKWVGIVFVAGFIGYFGKRLGIWLIEKASGKKVVRDYKAEKKMLKLEKKRMKASG